MPPEDHLPITGAEVSALARSAAVLRRVFRRPDPVAVLKRRAEVQEEIRKNLEWPEHDEVPEILIVKHNRADRYGEPDRRIFGRGASDWLKKEVKGLHDRGLELYSAIEYVAIRHGVARTVASDTPGARKVWVVGRLPYERIAWIDWRPDPGYSSPRFYVVYTWRREIYREVVLYVDSGHGYEMELHDVKYKGRGGGPLTRLRRYAQYVRFNLESRREEKRWRSEGYD